MSGADPELLVPDDPDHGVTRLARELRDEVAVQRGPRSDLRGCGVHVHFTDRLYGRSAAEAAGWFAALAVERPVTVTLHDLPQASDGTSYDARASAYRSVARAARGVVCNSEHERLLLAELAPEVEVRVIPLPTHRLDLPDHRPDPVHAAAVLGYFYPGKGHDQAVQALARLPEPRPALLVLGGASRGHEQELADLVGRAAAAGVGVSVTGYLGDEAMLERCLSVAVPVVAHEHVSASGSLNSWLSAGRRPLVRDSRYAREMAALRPGSCTVYAADGLASAMAAALADPDSTWLPAGTDLRPHLCDVAAGYLAWWREDVTW